MKNWQLFEIKKNWDELKSISGNKDYYLPLVKNIKLIEVELEALELMKPKSEEFDKFMKEKDSLLKKYSVKDSNGEAVKIIEDVEGVQYYKYDIDPNNLEEFNSSAKELSEKYREPIEEVKSKELAYMSALNAESTVTFNKIKECNLPSVMSPKLTELIYDFIEFE